MSWNGLGDGKGGGEVGGGRWEETVNGDGGAHLLSSHWKNTKHFIIIVFFNVDAAMHPYKRVWMPPKIEIFVDLNRAGHDRCVKKISVLAQTFTKLWPFYELHLFILFASYT